MTYFVRLPRHLRMEINGGCSCPYCKARPDETPKWDTLAIDPSSDSSWTVHYPELGIQTIAEL